MDLDIKYRIPSKYNLKDIFTQLNLHLDLLIYKPDVDYNKPVEYFNEWKCNVITKINLELCNN